MLHLFMGPVVAAVAEGTASSLMSTLPLILIMVVLMAVMIIPQRKRDKKVKEMLASIRPGDRVRTIGGIYGTITSVKDDYVVMQVGPDKIHLVFARGAISQIEEKGAENTMNESVWSNLHPTFAGPWPAFSFLRTWSHKVSYQRSGGSK